MPGPLPLMYVTPPSWVQVATASIPDLLSDHAHLEAKAASNALTLMTRFPGPHTPPAWTRCLADVAREEAEHLRRVLRMLEESGNEYTKHHVNAYAAQLRAYVRKGQGDQEVLDRLLVSALIEARSCERFGLLAGGAPPPLARLYKGLCASERGHYLTFLELARHVASEADVEARWRDMLTREAAVIARQPPAPRMHSGVGGLQTESPAQLTSSRAH